MTEQRELEAFPRPNGNVEDTPNNSKCTPRLGAQKDKETEKPDKLIQQKTFQ